MSARSRGFLTVLAGFVGGVVFVAGFNTSCGAVEDVCAADGCADLEARIMMLETNLASLQSSVGTKLDNLTVTAEGQWGLGTADPGMQLEVSTGSATANGGIRITKPTIRAFDLALDDNGIFGIGVSGSPPTLEINDQRNVSISNADSLQFRLSGGDPVQNHNGDFALLVGGGAQEFSIYDFFNNAHRVFIPGGSSSRAGNVGLGTTAPDYKLHVVGQIGHQGLVDLSSRALKKDIEYMPTSSRKQMLRTITELRLAHYRYKTEVSTSKRHVGLIAEDLPDPLVTANRRGVRTKALMSYSIGAIQALHEENRLLKAQLRKLSAAVAELERSR